MAVLNGCSLTESMEFELNAPLINGTFDADYNYIHWLKVEGADFYEVYGLEIHYDGLPGQDEPYPKDPRKFNFIGLTRDTFYRHETTKDFAYAVRAYSDDGKSSDYSGIIFTEEWLAGP